MSKQQATLSKQRSTLSKQHSTLLPQTATMSNDSVVKFRPFDKVETINQSINQSFICLKEQKHIQTSRITKAKYALTGVLMKDNSSIRANF